MRLMNHGQLNKDQDLTRHVASTEEAIMNIVPYKRKKLRLNKIQKL